MPLSARLHSRLRGLERALGPTPCPACADRPPFSGLAFRFNGRLTDGQGRDIDPAHLEPCPRCGRGGVGKTMDGADPGRLLGVRVMQIDPANV